MNKQTISNLINNDSKRCSNMKVGNGINNANNVNYNNTFNQSVEKYSSIKSQELNQMIDTKEIKFTENSSIIVNNSNSNVQGNQNNQNIPLNSNSNTLNKYFKSIATSKGQAHKKNSASMY